MRRKRMDGLDVEQFGYAASNVRSYVSRVRFSKGFVGAFGIRVQEQAGLAPPGRSFLEVGVAAERRPFFLRLDSLDHVADGLGRTAENDDSGHRCDERSFGRRRCGWRGRNRRVW